jgi:hypothetical protein
MKKKFLPMGGMMLILKSSKKIKQAYIINTIKYDEKTKT